MFKKYTVYAVILFIGWPFIVWGVDATYYAVVGEWLTNIPWSKERGEILLLGYPVLITIVASLVFLTIESFSSHY